jgi:arylsulfatase A-like enzyme/lysophospholipase L1-like esterase
MKNNHFHVWSRTSVIFAVCLGMHFAMQCSALAIAPADAERATDSKQPNVLLIIADDQGYGDIGFHGNTMIETPHLDRLAQESVRLTNFHVDPTCAETRAALMSGQYAMRGGVWHTVMGRSFLNAERWTMPQAFQAAGYKTGIFGKWHLGDNSPYRPWERGFDESLIHGGGGVGQVPDHWGNDYFDDTYLRNGHAEKVTGYCTNVFAGAAAEFMASSKEQPFFCYLAFNAPHSPYNVPGSFEQKYLNKGVEKPMSAFYGMIDCIDSNVGRLLEQLQGSGVLDNTIVIYMTDNGTAAGISNKTVAGKWSGYNAGMRGTKGTVYEGGHRVPCFIRYPKQFKADHEVKQLTAHFDLLPTLVQLCGLSVPQDWKSDGVSLVGVLKGEDASWKERKLVVQSQRIDHPEKRRKFVVADQRWRLVGDELFDLENDPGQTKNVSAQYPDVVQQLNAFYDSFWGDVAKEVDQYQRIYLGSDVRSETYLTAHDWHSQDIVAYQGDVNRNRKVNGMWAVDVKRPGAYQFRLRMRPDGVAHPVGGTFALVRSNNQESYRAIQATADEAVLTLTLDEGPAMIKTVLKSDESSGEEQGFYFAYVRFLGEATNETVANETTKPSKLETNVFQQGDRVALLGATLFERMQMQDELEAILVARTANLGITFRNVAWSGDDASGRARAVFGGYEEGYQRRLKDLAAAKPTHVLVAYGMNEAFDKNLSIDSFKQQMGRLLDDLSKANYRVTLLLPPALEAAEKDVRLVNYKERYPQIVKALTDIGSDRKLPTVAMPMIKSGWTSNGIHLNAAGYSEYSRQLANVLVSAECQLELNENAVITLAVNNANQQKPISLGDKWNLQAIESSNAGEWRWKEISPCLPLPLRSTGELMPVDMGPDLSTKVVVEGLAEGEYVLEISGEEVAKGSASEWAKGIGCAAPGLQQQTEKLRRLLHRKNDLFFHHYRPQNETYLFLFRKHEQGNNAVEIDQFPPLMAPLETEASGLSHVSEVVWVLRKK